MGRLLAEILLGGGVLGAFCGYALTWYLDKKFKK